MSNYSFKLFDAFFLLQHRRLLYDLFTKNYRVKRNMVQARLAQEFGDISKADIDRLLHVRWVTGLNISVFEGVFSRLWSNLWCVVAGVLQQLCRDVVPQGNDTVLTLRACPLRSPSLNQILISQVSSGRAVRQMRANHSSPSSEDKDVSRLLCSEQEAFLVPAEAFLTLTRALWCSAEDRNSSHTHTKSWSVWGGNMNIEKGRYTHSLSVHFWIYDFTFHYFQSKLLPDQDSVYCSKQLWIKVLSFYSWFVGFARENMFYCIVNTANIVLRPCG